MGALSAPSIAASGNFDEAMQWLGPPAQSAFSRILTYRIRERMGTYKRVALLIESFHGYGRGCLMGIAAYVQRMHGPWRILHLEQAPEQSIPSSLSQWKSDGLIAHIENSTIAKKVETLRLPTVDLRGSYCPAACVVFETDARACAQLAADHFLDRGFWQFACCGFPGFDYSDRRCNAFVSLMTARGHNVPVYERPSHSKSHLHSIPIEASGELEARGAHIEKWLLSLPRPTAIYACDDVCGRQVLASCAAAGLVVPDDIAVLGVDDDEVICGLSFPSLSSICPDTYKIGLLGAEALDAMMLGQAPKERRIAVPPRGLSARRSTDVFAHIDRELAEAVRFIRDHACDNISVTDVARVAHVSRATLERRFNQNTGRSPAEEITRVRIERAKMLLVETDFKLSKIASITGFSTASHLSTVFKRNVGTTPGHFRTERPTIGNGMKNKQLRNEN